MKSKTVYRLVACLIIMVGHLNIVHAVTDAELEALEKQIEQLESDEKKQTEAEEKKKAEAEAKRTADQKRKANAEAEKKQAAELKKQRIEEDVRLAKESKEREEEEKKNKYITLIAEAEQAVTNKDKELAISKYNEALALFPGDVVATRGLVNAEGLKHKLCYEVLGKWIWDRAFGKDYIILYDGGSLDYQTSIKGSGNWECTSPETRTIKLRVSAAGFSNEWLSTYSADGSCLLGPETWGDRGCYHRPESGKKSGVSGLQEQTIEISINSCSKIIGVWRWNDLMRTITRFYEDGKVVSKNILKSEGNWECVDPENNRFTFNTWNKKREIQIEDDYKKLHSVSALGGKIIANKISDDPFEKIVPAKSSSSNIPGL